MPPLLICPLPGAVERQSSVHMLPSSAARVHAIAPPLRKVATISGARSATSLSGWRLPTATPDELSTKGEVMMAWVSIVPSGLQAPLATTRRPRDVQQPSRCRSKAMKMMSGMSFASVTPSPLSSVMFITAGVMTTSSYAPEGGRHWQAVTGLNTPIGGRNSQTSTASRGTQRERLTRQISSTSHSSVTVHGSPRSTHAPVRHACAAVQQSSPSAPHLCASSAHSTTQRSIRHSSPAAQHSAPHIGAAPQPSLHTPALHTCEGPQHTPPHVGRPSVHPSPASSPSPPSVVARGMHIPSRQTSSAAHSSLVLQGVLVGPLQSQPASRIRAKPRVQSCRMSAFYPRSQLSSGMALAPCPQCARHVRLPALACPFCGGETAYARPGRRWLATSARFTRAAIFAGAAFLGACAEEEPAPEPAPAADEGDRGATLREPEPAADPGPPLEPVTPVPTGDLAGGGGGGTPAEARGRIAEEGSAVGSEDAEEEEAQAEGGEGRRRRRRRRPSDVVDQVDPDAIEIPPALPYGAPPMREIA